MPVQNSSVVQDHGAGVSINTWKINLLYEQTCGLMEDVEQKNLQPGHRPVSNENPRALARALQLSADSLAE